MWSQSIFLYNKKWNLTVIIIPKLYNFLNYGFLDASIYSIFITLIPKVKNPSKVIEYIPISLCDVLYKLITKILSNRLKKVMPHIISQNHSTSIIGRLVSYNIMVAYEALHFINARIKRNDGYMTLKLYINKACDRVEWDFLKASIRNIGFA